MSGFLTLALDEVAERASLAARYAEAAAALAAAGDVPGMTHSLACAARVILAATQAAETLRPAAQEAAQ
ncbi:hypothetical protein MKK69_20390 [Methylobacterium sp. J-026]|uniref:hypothetical protein n=1 Tax=Methylobacterium sp. J-026 TaxID=2836624 RepID=UPI001FBB76FE|nr:hypothetical protein [Methylobacterium sp. J-026]MCJ2136379.1 hypothetical protein [Methylobacterium sp. J-026]